MTATGLAARCRAKARMTYPDGSVYVGGFKADQPDGQGKITYADGYGL